MRPADQPAIPAALKALVAAVPVEALRELVLTLLNGTTASAGEPATEVRKRRGWPKGKRRKARGLVPDPDPKVVARRRKAAAYQRARRAKLAKAEQAQGAIDAKIAARRKREAQRQRDKRAAAKAKAVKAARGTGKQTDKSVRGGTPPNSRKAMAYQRKKRAKLALAGGGRGPNPPSPGLDGNGTKGPGGKPEITPAQLWQHAEALQPLAPWRAVARELDLNTAQMQSCYRHRSMPPNLSSGAVEKFCALELPAG